MVEAGRKSAMKSVLNKHVSPPHKASTSISFSKPTTGKKSCVKKSAFIPYMKMLTFAAPNQDSCEQQPFDRYLVDILATLEPRRLEGDPEVAHHVHTELRT